jgi:hypothetical protein
VNATQITYWVRVSENTFTEVSPIEITQFLSEGYVLDIRIQPYR